MSDRDVKSATNLANIESFKKAWSKISVIYHNFVAALITSRLVVEQL